MSRNPITPPRSRSATPPLGHISDSEPLLPPRALSTSEGFKEQQTSKETTFYGPSSPTANYPSEEFKQTPKDRKGRRGVLTMGVVSGITAIVVSLFIVRVLGARLDTSPYDVPPALAAILAQNSSAWEYPTAITRGIVPKFIHSHNDYWRDVPYYSALSVGAVSVEADIWLYNDTLYVGHEESALTTERTLEALYINPILKTLQTTNPKSQFVTSSTRNGVFDTDSSQTLYLWLDCKTSGEETFKAAVKALTPLYEGGWLTTYSDAAGVTPGPVTVIGTGNTPLNLVQGVSPRHYFFDAPLPDLSGSASNITSDVSPIASTDFGAVFPNFRPAGSPYDTQAEYPFTEEQLSTLRSQIGHAKSKGIGARYWDTPGWPTAVRNGVWATLWKEGVALVNVDDLVDGAGLGTGPGGVW